MTLSIEEAMELSHGRKPPRRRGGFQPTMAEVFEIGSDQIRAGCQNAAGRLRETGIIG
jgi:hypothetical protein